MQVRAENSFLHTEVMTGQGDQFTRQIQREKSHRAAVQKFGSSTKMDFIVHY